jgi:MoxR-like ATPase
LPDDIQYLAPFVLSHRIILKSEAKFEGISAEEIVTRVIARIPVPIQRLVK